MPPRRGRAASSKASMRQSLTAEEEESRLNRDLLLEDVDKNVDLMVKNVETSVESSCKSIVSLYIIGFMKLDPNTKALTLEQYLEKVP